MIALRELVVWHPRLNELAILKFGNWTDEVVANVDNPYCALTTNGIDAQGGTLLEFLIGRGWEVVGEL